MLNFLEKYTNWFYVGALIVAIIFIFGLIAENTNLKFDKLNLQSEIDSLNYKLATEKNNYNQLKDRLENQNKIIDDLKIDYEKNIKEFEDWKNKPVEIKYKEVKSNECKDIKLIIDDIRNSNF